MDAVEIDRGGLSYTVDTLAALADRWPAAEQWDHTFNDNFELFATGAQFVYQAAAGNGFTNGLGADTSNYNTFMYAEQAGFKYNFDKDTFFKADVHLFFAESGKIGVDVDVVLVFANVHCVITE